MNLFAMNAFAASIAVGSIAGAIPMLLGIFKGHIGRAFLGYAACVIAGYFGGLLLAVPVCGLFVWLIVPDKDPKTENIKTTFSAFSFVMVAGLLIYLCFNFNRLRDDAINAPHSSDGLSGNGLER